MDCPVSTYLPHTYTFWSTTYGTPAHAVLCTPTHTTFLQLQGVLLCTHISPCYHHHACRYLFWWTDGFVTPIFYCFSFTCATVTLPTYRYLPFCTHRSPMHVPILPAFFSTFFLLWFCTCGLDSTATHCTAFTCCTAEHHHAPTYCT